LEERTPVLLLFNIAQQLGLLLGPACNLFLREVDFHIGSIHVNKLNAPGLFLAFVYILFEIVAALMYYDLKVAKDLEENPSENDDNAPILNQDILSEGILNKISRLKDIILRLKSIDFKTKRRDFKTKRLDFKTKRRDFKTKRLDFKTKRHDFETKRLDF
jgi:hypothetical protein